MDRYLSLICVIHICINGVVYTQGLYDIPCPLNCTCVPSAKIHPQLYNVTCNRSTIPRDFPSPPLVLMLQGLKLPAIPERSFVELKHLEHLYVWDSNIDSLLNTSFEGLSHLRYLNLTDLSLKRIEAAAFSPLSQIRTLILEKNWLLGLKMVGDSLYGLQRSPLESLHLYHISNKDQHGSVLDSSFFRYLISTRIKFICLKKNQIGIFKVGYSKYLSHLEHLDLSENSLIGEIRAFYEVWILRGLRFLDVHEQTVNSIKANSIKYRLKDKVSVEHITERTSPNLCLPLPPRLETLIMNNIHSVTITEQAWPICKPNSLKFVDFSYMNMNKVGLLTGLDDLEYLAMQGNFFIDLPFGFFDKFPNLNTALFGNNRLGDLVGKDLNGSLFRSNRTLTSLDFADNGIRVLSDAFMKRLRNLKFFNVSRNQLQSIDSFRVFTAPVVINASGNEINEIAYEVLRKFENFGRNLTLDISHNPLTTSMPCCKIIPLINWVKRARIVIHESQTFSCLHNNNIVRLSGLSMSFLYRECESGSGLIVILVAVCLSLCVFSISVASFCFRKRYTVMWWLTLIRRYSRLRADALTDINKEYDAFVAYNARDIKWVRRRLEKELEEKRGYKLCLHERDFTPGRYIIDNIVTSIHKSRRAIFVVTEDFLESDWCDFEVGMAQRQCRVEAQFFIIPVLFSSYRPQKASLLLRVILDQTTYIPWPGSARPNDTDLFWETLSKALGQPLSQTNGMRQIEGGVD